uniref:G-protein coupled receptors family 1 profile domain-containing protein n=2 Tax=Meloidogyne incognita group TaxID=654580 RepID=A0A914KUN9_MELIC
MEILNSFSPLNLTQKHQETSIDIFETPHISFVTTLINGAAEAMNYLDENITNGNESTEDFMQEKIINDCVFLPTTENFLMIFTFSMIFCLSVVGNSIVIVVILQQKSMHSVTNLYLLNLALSDLLLSVVCMPPTLVSSLVYCWVFGDLLCKLLAYLQPVVVTASAYTLAAIALERYYAICRPLQSRIWHTRTHAKFMISLVWSVIYLLYFGYDFDNYNTHKFIFQFFRLASIIVNLFMLFMYEERKFNTNGLNCSPKFKPLVHFSYQIYMTVMLLVIPLVAMTVLYGSVIRTLSSGIFVDLASKEVVDKTENLENRQQNLSNSKWYKRPSLEGGCSKGSRLSLVAMIKNELKLGLREPTIATSCLRQNRTSNGQVVEVNLRSTQAEKSAIAKKR